MYSIKVSRDPMVAAQVIGLTDQRLPWTPVKVGDKWTAIIEKGNGRYALDARVAELDCVEAIEPVDEEKRQEVLEWARRRYEFFSTNHYKPFERALAEMGNDRRAAFEEARRTIGV